MSGGVLDVKITNDCVPNMLAILQALEGKQIKRALSRAVNKTMRGAVTDFGREVPKSYNVRKRDVTRSFSVRSAAVGRLEATAISSGRPVALAAFGVSPAKPGGRVRRGLSVKVGAQRKTMQGPYFVAGVETGHIGTVHIGVFRRRGDARLPIKQAYGPSISQMIGNRDISDTVKGSVLDRFRRVLPQELNFELSKLGLKA